MNIDYNVCAPESNSERNNFTYMFYTNEQQKLSDQLNKRDTHMLKYKTSKSIIYHS